MSEIIPIENSGALSRCAEFDDVTALQCKGWALRGHVYCTRHLDKDYLPNANQFKEAIKESMQIEITNIVPELIDIELSLARTSTSDAVKLQAAKDLLDRAGFKAPSEQNITVKQENDAAATIAERLSEISARAVNSLPSPDTENPEDFTDGEIVYDSEEN